MFRYVLENKDALDFYNQYKDAQLPTFHWDNDEYGFFDKNDEWIFMLFYFAHKAKDQSDYRYLVAKASVDGHFRPKWAEIQPIELGMLAYVVFCASRAMNDGINSLNCETMVDQNFIN